MQPLDDEELSKVLSEWRVPGAPESLEARLLKPKGSHWWQWFVQGRIQVPVPLATAALVALLVWAAIGAQRELDAEGGPGGELAGFQLVEDLNPRIIRGTYEND